MNLKLGNQFRLYSATVLAIGGIILLVLGLYFIFLRPPLLSEDLRFMGTSLAIVNAKLPGLLKWLSHVFWVMGGFIFSTGLLTCHFAFSSFRKKEHGAVLVTIISGLTSIGLMAAVNFIIASDFKWTILVFTFPWLLALALYYIEKKQCA